MMDDHRTFFELSPDLLCVLDFEGRVLDLSPSWQHALGLAAEEVVGTLLAEHVFEADRAVVAGALRDLSAPRGAAEALHFVCRIRAGGRSSGGYRWIAWNASALVDSSQILAVGRDVTDEEQRRQRLLSLFNAASDLISLTARSGEVLYVNPAGLDMLGHAGRGSTPLSTSHVLAASERSRIVREVVPALNSAGLWSGETNLVHATGNLIPTAMTLVWVRSDAGVPEAFGSIAIDLRARRRALTNLRELKVLLDNTTDLVSLAHLDGRVIYINPGGMALLGRDGEDPTSLMISDLVNPDEMERERDVIRPALLDRGIWAGERRLRRKDGALVPVSDVVTLLRDELGEPDAIATISRDLTDSKRLQASLKEAISALGAPILRVAEGVLAVPLVGRLDRVRAARVMDALLRSLSGGRAAKAAILDLTGVRAVDSATVEHLFTMVAAASLLGAETLVSGISPAVAQAIVELNLETRGLRSFGTLEKALRSALRQG